VNRPLSPLRLVLAPRLIASTAAPSASQPLGTEALHPAFSLSSGQIFTTRDSPVVYLTFQQIDHVDFRVYRVKDALRFFAGLRDPHVLGSPEPVVPQEQTWVERIANWKAGLRSEVRDFFRRQVSRK
jgi:hypothetical protein